MKAQTKTKERCLKGFALLAFAVSLSAEAHVDQPSVREWSGTAYHDGGWFTFQMPAPYAEGGAYPDGAMKFDKTGEFVLSPLYPAPIRKMLVKAACSSASPTRTLQIAPFVAGVEAESLAGSLSASDDVQVLDFSPSANVTAFRLFVGGSGSTGVWGVSDVCVFYGEKTADEDAVLLEFASQLPAPENLRAEAIAADALTVAADAVSGASGYRFEVFRLEGTPETVAREDFASAPALSSEGWTFGAVSNASLGMATSSYVDGKSAGDAGALKIEKGKGDEPVVVEIVSPEFAASVSEVSYVSKRSTGDSSDRITVYGRASGSSEWNAIAEPFAIATSQKWTTNAVAAAGVRQVKFVFTASGDATCRPCGIDSLRVVYGGDETRTAVAGAAGVSAEPRLSLTGLVRGRHAFRVQAVGGDGCRDSSWSEERIVDLAWADIVVAAPTGVAAVPSGDTLAVSWEAAAGAERYLVSVTSADDPDAAPILAETAATQAEVSVPAIGDYFVAVTAFSPGGVSEASSDGLPVTVPLGRVASVSAEATDVSEVSAAWGAVPLAEGYRVNIYRLAGDGGRTPAGTAFVTACAASFGGLDPSAAYVVEVIPQPSDDAALGAQSESVDLSAARFRKTGAAPLPQEEWVEGFDALAGMRSATEVKRLELDYWQFAKGSAEPEKLLYTSGASSTAGGVYAFSDAAHTTNSYALGSLASGDYGCTFGIALVNAGELAVERDVSLSFDMIQRSYRKNGSAYVLEWKVTDGETGILSEGGWTAAEIPASAPWAAGDEGCPAVECRQTANVALSLPARLATGGVLVLRWRHPKVASGPMMAIDNVRLGFRRQQQALRVTVR